MNPLVELSRYGQSPWYDNIQRSLITNGEIQRMIDEDGLRGITSNPTIFEKAISGSADYDESFKRLVAAASSTDEIYEALVVEDIRNAADLLRPVYDQSAAADGFVSIEVSPLLADDTETTIQEARRLWKQVDRPNVMIKVPGTPEGIPALETLIGEGINVNATLLFSLESYEQIANAYIAGLAKLSQTHPEALRTIASVASFFVSRVDAAVDKALEEKASAGICDNDRALAQSLMGTIGIANSRLAYARFKEIFASPDFQKLKQLGARPQRVLWASTGTKNPRYSDVLYIESLIGPDTVNTIPPATMKAFRDHGRVELTLEREVDQAKERVQALQTLGLSLSEITHRLQVEGVKLFADSFTQLLNAIEQKRQQLRGATPQTPIP